MLLPRPTAPGFSAPATRIAQLLLLGLVISACASGPPVQEMSDARQAIAAAREAGAEEFDAPALRVAETRLVEAEAQLQHGVFWAARKAALGAKESAIEALLQSRSRRENGAGGPKPLP